MDMYWYIYWGEWFWLVFELYLLIFYIKYYLWINHYHSSKPCTGTYPCKMCIVVFVFTLYLFISIIIYYIIYITRFSRSSLVNSQLKLIRCHLIRKKLFRCHSIRASLILYLCWVSNLRSAVRISPITIIEFL
jgi:hypothetical protein